MKKLLILLCIGLLVNMAGAATLTHQYTFNDGTANDSVGGLTSTLESGAYVQGGSLILQGGFSPGPRAVLDGPGIGINGYAADGISIEAWYTMNAPHDWQRLFDFGNTYSGWAGGYYLFYTPSSGFADSRLVISDTQPGYNHEEMAATAVAATGAEIHVVCIYDPIAMEMRIYEEGSLVANASVTISLAVLDNTFAYLGSAVYPGDPELDGSINEFNIYSGVLTDDEIADNYAAGPIIPEPATMALLGLGALIGLRRRK